MRNKIILTIILGMLLISLVSATTTVTLNSPPNYLNNSLNTVTFNCSAISNSEYLNNFSLWTNSTGSWSIFQTDTAYLNDTYENLIVRNYNVGDFARIYETNIINSNIINYSTQWKETSAGSSYAIFEFEFSNGTKINSSTSLASAESISDGTKLLCLFGDATIPYVIVLIFSLAIGAITSQVKL